MADILPTSIDMDEVRAMIAKESSVGSGNA